MLSGRIRIVKAALISRVPFNFLRIWLYRFLCGYQISSAAKIGFGTILDLDEALIGRAVIGQRNMFQGSFSLHVKDGARIGHLNSWLNLDKVEIGRASIGRHNIFRGPFSLYIKDGARVVADNIFKCGSWALEDKFQDAGYLRRCVIESDALITDAHFIDTVGGFELGEHSWIGGRNSQFWTHGAGVTDRFISIGSNCYIGSAVRFAPGAAIGDHNIVSLGSVVTKKFDGNHLLIGGMPARIIKEKYDWVNHTFVQDLR